MIYLIMKGVNEDQSKSIAKLYLGRKVFLHQHIVALQYEVPTTDGVGISSQPNQC